MPVQRGDLNVVVRQTEPLAARERRLRYFITFGCYGSRLHGDESGSVDRFHNLVGSRVLESDPQRVSVERQSMPQTPYHLDPDSRAALLRALRQHCAHVIVEAEARPERVMNEFKSYASRELNRLGRDEPDRRRWARHGSTRWLWKDRDVEQAIRYVIGAQGEPMALFLRGQD